MKPIKFRNVILATSLALTLGFQTAYAQEPGNTSSSHDVSDAALVASLPGFESGFAQVNGVRLHYVAGGSGDPVFLLPGWPQTWWAYHKMMPELAGRYRVISVDIRGMGASEKPADGYDKKTMARDIYELVRHLGYEEAVIVGHDIGAQVAFAFAANHPEATRKLVLLDVAHPDEDLLKWPLLPVHGTFGDKIDPKHPYAWWFAFHQVKGLPEDLLEGRAHIEHEWFFRYLAFDEGAIGPLDRAVYAQAYNGRDDIRAGNAWYQAFTQDVIDYKSYGKLDMPVLALGGPGYDWLKATLPIKATDLRVEPVPGSGHFIPEEKPDVANRMIIDFLDE